MRERIIREIQLFVTEHDGQVPGIKSFEIYSGIARKEWLGKIWARWGDVLVEAGFAPNTLTGRMDSEAILAQFAQACIDFGRLPSSNDLRIYGRTHSHFPSTSTLENHFKTRAELIENLRSWVSANESFSAVLQMLPGRIPAEKAARERSNDGLVYLLKSGNYYKIGRSDQIERRLKEIRVTLPQASALEHTIQTDDPAGIEAYWHRRFADRRANGEWFQLTRADILALKRRKFQ